MDQEFDLWGDPIPQRVDRRGRPEHQANDERRNLVKALRGNNETATAIAKTMGISERTLRKHYLPELQLGRERYRSELIFRLYVEAMKGNVSAIKLALKVLKEEEIDSAARAPLERPAKIGKKIQALMDAEDGKPETSIGELLARRRDDSSQVH